MRNVKCRRVVKTRRHLAALAEPTTGAWQDATVGCVSF